MIATVSLTLIAGIYILALQDLAKGGYLLPETVLGHHQRKVETGLRLTGTATQQMEYHPATEPDDGRTLAIGVLNVVDILGCLHTLLLAPLLDGFPQTRGIDEATIAAKSCHSLLNPYLILCRATAELRHLLE